MHKTSSDTKGTERYARRAAHRVVRWAGSHRMPIEASGVAIVSIIVLALRAPFAIGRLWAEDGSVFLQQARDRGVVRSFGQAYAGYYHLVPRVIGALASAVPIREAALITWLGVAVVVGWCAATIYVESTGWLATRPTRLLLAFSVVVLPALGLEAIANSANLQYTLLFTSLIALASMSTGRWSSVNRAAIAAVTALTTPLALFLAPIAAVRVFRRRPRRLDATVTAWGIATAVQIGMILITRPRRIPGSPGDKARIVSYYDHRVLYENLLPKQVARTTIAPIATLFGVVLVLLAAGLALRSSRRRTALLLLLIPAIGFAFWTYAAINYGSPARYRVFPGLCVIWSVLVASEELIRALRPRVPVDWRLAGIIVTLLALSWFTYWRPPPHRASGPAWSTALSSAEHRCRIEHVPTVVMRISPVVPGSKFWGIGLRCDDVVRH